MVSDVPLLKMQGFVMVGLVLLLATVQPSLWQVSLDVALLEQRSLAYALAG